MPAKLISLILFISYMVIFPVKVSAESLRIAVFKTLASNPEIKSEINRKNARQEELRQAKAGQYPSVDLMAAIGNENSKNRYTQAAGATDYVKLTRQEEAFVVTYNLFEGFATSNNIDKNTARVLAADHQLHNLTEQTALQVADVYLNVMRYQELVHLSEKTLDMHKQTFNKVRSRSKSGVGRLSDINQARGRVARAQANLIADKTSLQNAQAMYFRVTGEMPENLSRPDGFVSKLPSDVKQAIALALENNPVLKAAQSELDAAAAEKKQSTSTYYPRLDLVFEQSRGENLDGIEGVENDYSLMLKMRYNLFNGGYDSARSKQALLQLNASRDKLDDIRRSVTESIQLAWNAYTSVNMQIPYLNQHVKSITETRSAYSNQFKIGKRSLLDLLDSENELYQSNRALISAEYDRMVSSYRIFTQMGRFVDELESGANKI